MASVKQLEKYLKTVKFEINGHPWGNDYVVEYERDGSFYLFAFNWNFNKNRYECGYSIYNASNDNNCENVDGNTIEEEKWGDTIEEIVEAINYDIDGLFEKKFYKQLVKEIF